MSANHPLPPECHDNQQRLVDAKFCRAPWKDWVDCKRRTANGWEFQSVMVRGKNEHLKTSVRTGNDTNLFSLEALVCRDETERWSREKPKDYSIPCGKPLNECSRHSNKGNQPSSSSRPVTEVVYSDNLFWQNGQHNVEHVWPYTGPTLQRHTPSGVELRTDKQDF